MGISQYEYEEMGIDTEAKRKNNKVILHDIMAGEKVILEFGGVKEAQMFCYYLEDNCYNVKVDRKTI